MDGNDIANDGASAIEYAADGSGKAGEAHASNGGDDGENGGSGVDGDDSSGVDGNGSIGVDDDGRETTCGDEYVPSALSHSSIDDVERRLSTVANIDLDVPTDATASDRVSSILVAVGGGPHSGAAIDTARELAVERDAWLELFHVVSPDDTDSTIDRGRACLSAATERLGDFDRVDDWLVEEETAAEAVVEQSEYYDAVVVGTPTTGRVSRFVFGSTAERVSEDAAAPVVVVEADGSTALIDDV